MLVLLIITANFGNTNFFKTILVIHHFSLLCLSYLVFYHLVLKVDIYMLCIITYANVYEAYVLLLIDTKRDYVARIVG